MARFAESVIFGQAPKEASIYLGDGMVQYQCKALSGRTAPRILLTAEISQARMGSLLVVDLLYELAYDCLRIFEGSIVLQIDLLHL